MPPSKTLESPTEPNSEEDIDLVASLWETVVAGTTPEDCEKTLAADAYRTAFEDADCLKMILDWRSCQ